MGSSELLCVALLAGTGAAYYYDVPPVYVSVAMSVVAGLLTYLLIPAAAQLFINARLYGIDLSKSTTDVKVAESMGVIVSAVYMGVMFLFIPFPFRHWWFNSDFPHHKVPLSSSSSSSLMWTALGVVGDDDGQWVMNG